MAGKNIRQRRISLWLKNKNMEQVVNAQGKVTELKIRSFHHCGWMANPTVESHQYWSILTLFLFSIMVLAA
ncbi:MAG: hypothetical protein C3F02_04305 [Parcubacteria group bacterium]|nr:MAG: hypothetical protein C3F02_04305 [Parcubacteria group bacterium]